MSSKALSIDAQGKKDKFFHPEYMVYADFFGKAYDELMSLADNQIVYKLRQMMNIALKNDEIYKRTAKLEKDLKLNSEESEKLWDDVSSKTYDESLKVLAKDKFFNGKYVTIA